jgi:glycogen operon protein
MATQMLSIGVPMMLGGDELSHSQQGNNNAYCQDNELTWLKWELDDRQKQFLEFTRKLIFLRRSQPVLHRRKFFLGRAIRGSDIKDISFLGPSGQEMSDEDWNAGFVKCLGVRLAGDLINDENERGEPIVGETLLILLNGHWEPIPFTLPMPRNGDIWDRILDTADTSEHPVYYEGGQEYPLRDRSFVVLAARPPQEVGHTATPEQVRTILEERRPGAAAPRPAPL